MEFRYLVSFLAIADELHFGRAAARVHLTQPSLSQQLQRLERTLGVTLVVRSSHEVRLTPAGEALREHADVIVRLLDRAGRAAREAAQGRVGQVRVGYNFTGWQELLPAALARMHQRFPDVAVELREQRSGPQQAAVAGGELDVAFLHGSPNTADLAHRFLMSVPIVALVGTAHPWAARASVRFAELAGQRCILFGRDQSPAMHDAIQAAAERTGTRLRVEDHVDDLAATAIVVATQPVVGFVSAHRGDHARASGLGSVPVPLTDPTPKVDLHAVWRAGDQSRAVRAFLGCVLNDSAGIEFHDNGVELSC
ncbi:LysR family transcriptional regulator [Actinokineospora auranticolor]|uniref:DNA-binding transcriptional LysR family regulator n=1 Tax=Actinokineospora auranticolor TaxID=155976 RepID=A0A2S6GI61_9PSEU|nr:LysR family transcriptional regulator [Actinokineospora auranticolor]PPK64909.1 DNA-binding transcriptional LysR family regulator [Actinokineospora auranticolor]